MSVSFLPRAGLPSLAYIRTKGETANLPAVVFVHGLRSDMQGTKATFLEAECAARGQSYLRFDCRGHGMSEGNFEDGTIGLWKKDALDIIDHVTTGPLILVGSSMGGWLSLLIALERKDRVAGVIGLAAAPDFTREIKAQMNARQKNELSENGFFLLPPVGTEDPLPITRGLLEDGEDHCLLGAPIAIKCPVRLIQGMKDADVPWQTAHRIANAITGKDKEVFLREKGDHRLSAPDDLALLAKTVAEIS